MDQVPIAFGLEEGVDQLFLQSLNTLCKYYTGQQGQTVAIDIRSIYNKQDDLEYPFIGVLTRLLDHEPISIGDAWDGNTPIPNGFYRATVNEVETEVLIQTGEIRELQRLVAFIDLNFNYGYSPITKLPWLDIFRQHGVVLNAIRPSPYERSDFESIQQRTENAQGRETQRRADIETLWETTMCLHLKVQCGVQINESDGVIQGINFVLNPSLIGS